MRLSHISLITLALFLFAAMTFGEPQRKRDETATRSLHGLVSNENDEPLEKAVVYLKNTRTLQVRTFITGADGNYHFHGLSPNVDYEVRAQYNEVSSSTRTLSSFDNRKEVTLNLKVNTKK